MISQTSSGATADVGIRQACAVYFKNFVDKFWTKNLDTSDSFMICQSDKEFVQINLVTAILAAVPAIRAQLLTVLNRVIRFEFPGGFQMINEQAIQLLQASDANSVSAGLLVTLEILKFRSSSSDKNLDIHVASFMPHLLRIGQQAVGSLASPATSSVEVHTIIKTIVKTFFTSIRYKLSKHLLSNSDNFVHWCTLLMHVIQCPVPTEELKAKDSDESYALDKNVFWKMKKWAFRAQNRIASRYGNPEEAKSQAKEEGSFAKVYSENFAEAVMNVNLSVVQSAMNGEGPLTDKICNLLTEYLNICVKGKKTWKSLRSHIQIIISHFLFPRICFTKSDEELWADDPQEFLKTVFFSFDDYDSTVAACSGLILDIVKARKKDTFSGLLAFLNSVMEAYAASPSSIEAQRQKDGVLYLMGSLSKILLTSEIKNDLEPFLTAHVVPDLSSPQKFLRLRSAWCLEQFQDLHWKNPESTGKMLQGVMMCLEDAELPVKAQACVTVGSLLDQEFCQQQITPHLGKIVQVTLQLTNQVELDSLSYVMDRLVSMYPDELSPYAQELTVQLRDSFLRLLESSLVPDEDNPGNFYFNDTDKMMAAIALLETLETVIGQMCSNADTCAKVELALVPIFTVVLERRLVDLISETVSLVESITFRRKAISMEMWSVFPQLLSILHSKALPEFLPDCSTTIENFISYGSETLLQNSEYMKAIFDIIDIAMTVDESDGGYDSDTDNMCSIDIMESLLLYCRGKIDTLLPHILELVGRKLVRVKLDSEGEDENCPNSSLIRYLEIVLNCLYYSAPLCLEHLQRQGWLGVFLSILSTKLKLDQFKRVHDRRLVILALASIFHVPTESLPVEISSTLSAWLPAFIDCVQAYPKALEEREKLKKEAEEEAEDGEYNEELADDIYGEINDDEEENEGVVGVAEDRSFDLEEGEDDDDEEEDEFADWEDSDELEEDLYFECPLDSVDFADLIRSTLSNCATNRPQSWSTMVSALTSTQANFLQTL